MKSLLVNTVSLSFLSYTTIVPAQECNHVAGNDWEMTHSNPNYGSAEMIISQGANDSLSGHANPDGCGAGWAISGSFDYQTGEFEVIATNQYGPYDTTYGCAPWVKVTGDVEEPGCNWVSNAQLHNPLPMTISGYDMDKTCDVPTGEASWLTSEAWGPLDDSTSYLFGAIISGNGYAYTGRQHQQTTDTGAPSWDYCSGTLPWTSLYSEGYVFTLGDQPPGASSYVDLVGRQTWEVAQIRAVSALPCTNGFGQEVALICSNLAWYPYKTNGLAYEVGPDYVASQRDGTIEIRPWP